MNTKTKQVHILFTADDFDCLWTDSMNWSGNGWEEQEYRFEFAEECLNSIPTVSDLKRIYWFETDASYAIAKAFLRGLKEDFAVAYDHAIGRIVIITDFGGEL